MVAAVDDDASGASGRPVLLEFSLPGLEGKFELLETPSSFWGELFSLLLMQSVLCGIVAYIVFNRIIQKRNQSGEPPASAYLLGYGVLIPSALMAPFGFIQFFRIENISVMVGGAALAVIIPFNCIQAIHNTSHEGVEESFSLYLGYYSSIIPFQRDKTGKPIPVDWQYIQNTISSVFLKLAVTVFMFLVLLRCDFNVFPEPDLSSWIHYLHWTHLLNNLLVAGLVSTCLDFGSCATGLIVTSLTGYKTIRVMRNPMLLSTSPSEFWGKRWNLMVQDSFKRGIYKPLRKSGYSRVIAAVSTFTVSGLLHEYVNTVISMKARLYPEMAPPYTPQWGAHSAFFLWNGAAMLVEYALSGSEHFRTIAENTPRPLKTVLVLLSVIPISHWFTDEYVRSGFFDDYSEGFPLLAYK